MKSYQSDLNENNWRKKIFKDGPTGTYIFPNWVNGGGGGQVEINNLQRNIRYLLPVKFYWHT